ncbi:MAG TPA: hypothetical protein VHA57_05295 [Actinomycetota bacterium]|nr:hypothetical protein [Actinomycetota bacterium]
MSLAVTERDSIEVNRAGFLSRGSREHGVSVEVDYGSTSAKGRPPGSAWLVRLRRGD